MWVEEPITEKSHKRDHPRLNSLNDLGKILVFSPFSFFSSLFSQALSVLNNLKTDLRINFTPNKPFKKLGNSRVKRLLYPYRNLDSIFLNPINKFSIDISTSYNIENTQTQPLWKDLCEVFPTL